MLENMSYSAMLKSELANLGRDVVRHCLICELYAIIRTSAQVCEKYGQAFISLSCENIFLASKFSNLLYAAFGFRAEVSVRTSSKSKKQHFLIFASGDNAVKVLKAIRSSMLLKQACCKQAYLKGVFLCCASVSDPGKNYHLEFVFYNNDTAKELMDILEYFEVSSKLTKRKKSYVAYIKDGEKISQVLGLLGAGKQLLDFENLRVFKTVSNEVNRKVNCETANMAKTAKAFVSFQEDIEYIEKTRGISYLSKPLKEVAELKLEHTSATLKEIGELLTPPISKSGVNHRLRKISEIADELRGDLYG